YGSRMGGAEFPARWQALRTAQAFALNYPTPIVLLALFAIGWMRRMQATGLLVFIGALFTTNLIFGFLYRVPDQYVFFFPCYMPLGGASGIGVAAGARTSRRQWVCFCLAFLPVLVYEVAPPLMRQRGWGLQGKRLLRCRDEYTYFLRPRKNGEVSAAVFCHDALQTAGPGGFLLADSTIRSPLIYMRAIAGIGLYLILESAPHSELEPAPPVAVATQACIDRAARAGGAFICDDTPGYFDPRLATRYVFVPTGRIFRLQPRDKPQ